MADVIDITPDNLEEAKAFLERAPETSLFLLSNIRAFGTSLGESLYSGNLKGLREEGGLCAVFCLTRGGSLVFQTGGRTEGARSIVDVAKAELLPIRGVLGEWRVAKVIWELLCEEGSVKETIASREVLYRLGLREAETAWPDAASPFIVRMLGPEDHEAWERLSAAFQEEMTLPLLGDLEQRKAGFLRSVGLRHWWGGFDGDALVSIGGIIAMHESIAQLGGVFTLPERRRRGINRAVMTRVIADSRDVHGLHRLFLFTGEDNIAARRLYESLGFERFGHFGLFFGEPRASRPDRLSR
jgi:predicted GNAT family acetyltransferase